MINSDTYREHLRKLVAMNGLDIDEIALPSEVDVDLMGLRLHYHDWGNEAAPPLLFLHGAGLTAHTWDVVCLTLRSSYHCLALDLRGHGDSQWADAYNTRDYADDVRALVGHIGIPAGRLHLVGMSMGGRIAVCYAGLFNDLASLTVIESAPETSGTSAGARRIRSFIDGAVMDSVEDFVKRSLEFNPRRNPDRLRASLLHNLHQLSDGKWSWKYDKRQFADRDRADWAASNREVWAKVPLISCPALVIRGTESDLVPDGAAGALAGQFVRGSYMTVARSGHTVQGDNPKDLAIAIDAFIRGLTGS